MENTKEYKYDVFLSWTGCDRELKNQISEFLTQKGYRVYDSDLKCRGEYRKDYAIALNESKVYLLILTDGLLENYGSEVKTELNIAKDFEAKMELNIAVLCLSNKFRYGKITPAPKDEIHWLYYSNTRGYSFNDTQKNEDGEIEQSKLQKIFEDCKHFIDRRDEGKPVISQAPMIKLAVKSKETGIEGNFFGRVKEIEQIKEKFNDNARIVILHGIGGMGKTQLANRVANILDSDKIFSYVQTVNVSDSDACRDGFIENWVEQVTFKSSFYLETDKIIDRLVLYNLRLEALTELPDYCLLVLDNYNALDFKAIEFLKNNLTCRVIVTTRKTLDENDFIQDKNIAFVDLGKMDELEAYEMFASTSHRDISKKEFRSVYKLSGGHTYALRIIAKLFDKLSDKSSDEIVAEIKSGMSTDSVNTDRDDGSIYEIFAKLYDMNNLDEDCIKILLNMSLIADGRIEENTLCELLNLPNGNAVNSLVDNCWLVREGRDLYLHPMISQMIFVNQKPGEKDCLPIINYIIDLCDVDIKNSVKSLRGMAEMLYFAIYRLSNAEGKLCVELWNIFEKINFMLGDVDDIQNKVSTLKEKLNEEGDKYYLVAYQTKCELEFRPIVYIDKLQELVNSLKYHTEDYKRVLRYLSVTAWHIVALPEFKENLTGLLVKVFDEAQRYNDDLAVLNILISLFGVNVKKGKSLASKYLKKRKRIERNGILLSIELLLIDAKFLKNDIYNKSVKIMSDLGNENYRDALKLALAHPILNIKGRFLPKRIEKLPDDDNMKNVLMTVIDVSYTLVFNNNIDIPKYFNAIMTLYKLNYESGLTMQNLSNIVTNFLNMVQQFPPHMRGELANLVSTHYTLDDYFEDDLNIEKLAELDIAREINYQLNNKLALLQSAMLVDVNKKYYAPNSPKVIDSLIQYANTLNMFGDYAKALSVYKEAYSILQENVKESVRLAEVCNAILSIVGLSSREYKKYKDVALKIYKEKTWDRFNTHYTFAMLKIKEFLGKVKELNEKYKTDQESLSRLKLLFSVRYSIEIEEALDQVIECCEDIAQYPKCCRVNMLYGFRGIMLNLANCRLYLKDDTMKKYVDKALVLFKNISNARLGRVSVVAKVCRLEQEAYYDFFVNTAEVDVTLLLKTIDECLKKSSYVSDILLSCVSLVIQKIMLEGKYDRYTAIHILVGEKGKYWKIVIEKLMSSKFKYDFTNSRTRNFISSHKPMLYKYTYSDVKKIRNHKDYFARMLVQIFDSYKIK